MLNEFNDAFLHTYNYDGQIRYGYSFGKLVTPTKTDTFPGEWKRLIERGSKAHGVVWTRAFEKIDCHYCDNDGGRKFTAIVSIPSYAGINGPFTADEIEAINKAMKELAGAGVLSIVIF